MPVARRLRFRHEPFVERNKFGTKRLDYIFRRAQELASHDFVSTAIATLFFCQNFDSF